MSHGDPQAREPPSAISLQTTFIQVEVRPQLQPGGQLAHAFVAFYFYYPVIPRVFPKPSSPAAPAQSPLPAARPDHNLSASFPHHLGETPRPHAWGGGRGGLPSSYPQHPALPLPSRAEPRLCERRLAPAQPLARGTLFPARSPGRDVHPIFPGTKSNPSLGGARSREGWMMVSDAVIWAEKVLGTHQGEEKLNCLQRVSTRG